MCVIIIMKGGMRMYNDKAKERTIKYLKEKRDKLTLNLPLGSKQRYKQYAEGKGKSLTGLIVELIEDDIAKNKSE